MSYKLYVGNLPFSCSEDDLLQRFQEVGTVTSVRIITNPETGRSKGFGFVEMDTEDDGEKAIREFNGKEFMGRPLTVNAARPRQEGGNGHGGGNRRPREGGFRNRDDHGAGKSFGSRPSRGFESRFPKA